MKVGEVINKRFKQILDIPPYVTLVDHLVTQKDRAVRLSHFATPYPLGEFIFLPINTTKSHQHIHNPITVHSQTFIKRDYQPTSNGHFYPFIELIFMSVHILHEISPLCLAFRIQCVILSTYITYHVYYRVLYQLTFHARCGRSSSLGLAKICGEI